MSLDWQIYRELFSLDENPIWGRFPNPPLATIAEKVGVSRKSVWRKLNEWRRSGFLRGYLILPHPSLLGTGLIGFGLKVAGPDEKLRLLDDLQLIDGVLYSSYEVGPRVDIIAVADTESAQNHRKELISRLRGVSYVGTSRKIWLPPCEGTLSERDLRIVAALRTSPGDSLNTLAGRVKMSVRTVTRRLAHLRQARAVLSHCLEDWTYFPGTVVGVQLEIKVGFDSRVIARKFTEDRPDCLEVPSQVSPRGASLSKPAFLALVESGPSIENLTATALALPGVVRADHFFPGAERGYSGWIDAQIERLVRGNS